MNELILLAALLGGPAYGYALKKTAGLIFGRAAMHPNVVYPLLKKFVRNRWVEQSSVPGERGQKRKQYRVTQAGKKYLLERLERFTEEDAADDHAFLFRVALFDALAADVQQAIVAARKSYLESRAMQLLNLQQETQARSFGVIALDRARTVVANELRWIRQLEEKLEKKKGDPQCKQLLTHLASKPQS